MLHIRCGSDIRGRLQEAGLGGDFLDVSDPYCQGPVLDTPDWLDRRAGFLAAAYGVPLDETRRKLAAAEAGLRAARAYDHVVLWFEHDTYDQLILAYVLAHLDGPRPELVSIDDWPGVSPRFIGLGQLAPEALRQLWDERRAVPDGAFASARTVWDGLRAADPSALAAAAAGVPGLPFMARALRRHLQELPWVADGLSLTERLVLQVLAERARPAGEVFSALNGSWDPLPFLGDTMLLHVLRDMTQAREAPFAGTPAWGQVLTLTQAGRAVLAGEADWLALGPPERWVGGVRAGAWRWDDAAGGPVMPSGRA